MNRSSITSTSRILGAGLFLVLAAGLPGLCQEPAELRRVLSLDGMWEIAQGDMDSVPEEFDRQVPVPGLVEMATPAFEEVGRASKQRQAFWYRRSFVLDGAVPAVAMLKVRKAKFGTRLLVNGQPAGRNDLCFTPGLFDIADHLKGHGQTNDIVLRIGAFRDVLPDTVQWGSDFEKTRYIPGIYDSVDLILTGGPYLVNVQTAPEIEAGRVRVVAEVRNLDRRDRIDLTYTLRECRSGKVVARGEVRDSGTKAFETVPLDFRVTIPQARLWSPEDPFLYELELRSAADSLRTRFGMRSFRFDAESGRAILNGKPYFMRGTNVCIFRFFEDPDRADLPWTRSWVRTLHQRFKQMHWNSIRYCIGFPPEIWYDIADEEGFLIQDEFPIWNGGNMTGWPAGAQVAHVAREYQAWVRERWNHPCVVIWDAQNETVTEVTGEALRQVRSLDLSNRPWDNGWSAPQHPDDCRETHPYLFSRYQNAKPSKRGPLADTLDHPSPLVPGNGPNERSKAGTKFNNPIVINEYAWLWLNRNGRKTTLTDQVYPNCWGPGLTVNERVDRYTRTLAALTEYWRSHRKCAGVLHFCGLGYSRPEEPRGQTSDHFIDITHLTYEPKFAQVVRDAFAPVGLMIDLWERDLAAGASQAIPVAVINDLYTPWQGTIRLHLDRGDQTVIRQEQPCQVPALGREIVTFSIAVPEATGAYLLTAELAAAGQEPVRSLRDIQVLARQPDGAKAD